jgi:hypothetical protein
MGGAMRESLESEIPDTAPYKEWLAIVGSIAVAVLIFVVLFSNGVVTSPDALTAKRLDVGVRPVTVSEARLRFDAPALGAVFAGAFLPPLLRPASVLASSGSILIAARPAGVMISA